MGDVGLGRIVSQTYTTRMLELTMEDIEKREKRRKRDAKFPNPTSDMLAFCKRLKPCPICEETPTPSIVGDYGDYSIKLNCSHHHVGCGDWYKGLAKAGKSWNMRTQEEWQIRIDREMEERLAKKRGH